MLSSGDYELILFLYTWKLTAQVHTNWICIRVDQSSYVFSVKFIASWFFPRFFAFREANQLSEEMSKETEFAVTLQVQFRNVFMRKLM